MQVLIYLAGEVEKACALAGTTPGAFRVIYVAKFEAAIHVLHAFQKKTQKTAKSDIYLAQIRYKMIGAKP